MSAYRETFRRHRLRYLLPALIAVVLVGAISYKAPTYVSTASLWVDNQVSSSSSLNVGPGAQQPQTPSAAEQTVLGELVTTKKFDTAVVAGAGVAPAQDSKLAAQISSGLIVTTPGPQVLQVSYTASSPALAHNMVKSIITQLQSFSQEWSREYARGAVAYYQAQVAAATRAIAQAKAAPNSSQSSSLAANLSAATTSLNQAEAQANGQDNFSTVVVLDQPTVDPAPTSGLKSVLTKALGAGMAALLISLLVIVFRTPGGQDKWDDEVSVPLPSEEDLLWPDGRTTPAGVGMPVDPREPVARPARVTPFAPLAHGQGAASHRWGGLVSRNMVMHQPFDDESQPSSAAEGGRGA